MAQEGDVDSLRGIPKGEIKKRKVRGKKKLRLRRNRLKRLKKSI